MTKTEEYKGHIIVADTRKVGRGWQWSYQIDGGPIHSGNDRPLPNEGIVLGEAISNAKFEIDQMG